MRTSGKQLTYSFVILDVLPSTIIARAVSYPVVLLYYWIGMGTQILSSNFLKQGL